MSVETDFNYLRSQISRAEDHYKIDEIEKLRKKYRSGEFIDDDESFLDIRLGGLNFYFRRDLAPASVDTYIEVFRDRAHMKLPQFQPQNNATVIDIGANEGFYSLYMRHHNPGLRLISVEPVPHTFQILQRNIKANGFDNIQIINSAVGNTTSTKKMDIYPHVSSISSEDIGILKRPWVDPELIRSIQVQQITLPSLLEKYHFKTVDLLKIDAEGCELQILENAISVLPRIQKMVVEWHTPELRKGCTDYLQKNGFTLLHEERRRVGDSYFINRH
ncbi:MAG: FkbM family methyltransferase [Candidatus Aminicenantaceae bacterium]